MNVKGAKEDALERTFGDEEGCGKGFGVDVHGVVNRGCGKNGTVCSRLDDRQEGATHNDFSLESVNLGGREWNGGEKRTCLRWSSPSTVKRP